MASMLHDGKTGRRYVVRCDVCGTTLQADSFEARDELRRAEGWSPATSRPDLCAECLRTRDAGGSIRRFHRR
jgi:hypothetical protein